MTPEEAIVQAGSKGKWNVKKSIAAKASVIYADHRLAEMFNAVKKMRDAQQEQLDEDTKGMSTIDRIFRVSEISRVESIIKGYDKALALMQEHVTSKPNE